MSCNFFIAEDNLFTKHPHYLKDASNPMFFSPIQFGDENMLRYSGAAPPWDWQTTHILSLGLHMLWQNKYSYIIQVSDGSRCLFKDIIMISWHNLTIATATLKTWTMPTVFTQSTIMHFNRSLERPLLPTHQKDNAVFELVIVFWAMIFELPHCESEACGIYCLCCREQTVGR